MLVKNQKPVSDNDFATQVGTYIAAILHRPIELTHWSETGGLPSFLSKRYELFVALIGHQPCLIAADRDKVDATPAKIAKHIAGIEKVFDGVVVYATRYLASDRRSRLIAAGVSFVVPGNQLYIPPLALDLRENFRARPKRGLDQLSPVAQVLLFYGVLNAQALNGKREHRTPTVLAKAVGYSAMSVGRAFEELAGFELARVKKSGRSKELLLDDDGRALIETARPLLRDPVRRRQLVQGQPASPPMKLCGESALANITGLSPPPVAQWAIHGDDRSWLDAQNFVEVADEDQADVEIELWYYKPDILSDHTTVDPLSLYAQHWDNANERIAQAAEDALEHVLW